MAHQEHVSLLERGVEQWNTWRQKDPGIQPNLSGADLNSVDLSGVDLSGANLMSAALKTANLSGANLSGADLGAAILNGAILRGADLTRVDLGSATLSGANLTNTYLVRADLSRTNLNNADLARASMGYTIVTEVDLRTTKGLTEIIHQGPSVIQLHTVLLPQDGAALYFLRGTGIPDEYIDTWRTTMMYPIQYHSLFISYSSKDDVLARRLHADLQANGVRCWFAPEDLKIGDKIRPHIDEAIHLQDKLLLILSEHALESSWVEAEVEAALDKEQHQKREVLFPVRLDDAVMLAPQAWAKHLRRSTNIGDFTNWTDPQAYQQLFERLLRDLKKADERGDLEMKR